MIDLTAKLGEINEIEHKGSKIYPQNQVNLDCITPPYLFSKHKCLSIILILVIVSHNLKKSKKKKQFYFFFYFS